MIFYSYIVIARIYGDNKRWGSLECLVSEKGIFFGYGIIGDINVRLGKGKFGNWGKESNGY